MGNWERQGKARVCEEGEPLQTATNKLDTTAAGTLQHTNYWKMGSWAKLQ